MSGPQANMMPGSGVAPGDKVVKGRLNVDSSGDDVYESAEEDDDDMILMSTNEAAAHGKQAKKGSLLEHH